KSASVQPANRPGTLSNAGPVGPSTTSLSCARKYRSTAFLIHWCTCHAPSIFSATRSVPAFRPAMISSSAFDSAGSIRSGAISFRRSNASSISEASDSTVNGLSCSESRNATRGFHTNPIVGHQGDADEPSPRLYALVPAREIAAGQDGDVRLPVQLPRKCFVVAARYTGPEIE